MIKTVPGSVGLIGRLCARLVDFVVMLPVIVLLGSTVPGWSLKNLHIGTPEYLSFITISFILINIIEFLQLRFWDGSSIGKKVLGIKVTMYPKGALTSKAILIRILFISLPGLIFTFVIHTFNYWLIILLLSIFLDSEKRGFYDKAASTIVKGK